MKSSSGAPTMQRLAAWLSGPFRANRGRSTRSSRSSLATDAPPLRPHDPTLRQLAHDPFVLSLSSSLSPATRANFGTGSGYHYISLVSYQSSVIAGGELAACLRSGIQFHRGLPAGEAVKPWTTRWHNVTGETLAPWFASAARAWSARRPCTGAGVQHDVGGQRRRRGIYRGSIRWRAGRRPSSGTE